MKKALVLLAVLSSFSTANANSTTSMEVGRSCPQVIQQYAFKLAAEKQCHVSYLTQEDKDQAMSCAHAVSVNETNKLFFEGVQRSIQANKDGCK